MTARHPSSAAIVLAGGKSTRLGRDKAGELLLGVTLLQRVIDCFRGLVDEYVVVSAIGQKLPPVSAQAGLRSVEDVYPQTGPLGGIYTGLSAATAPCGIVAACDMPLLQPALLAELLRLAAEHELVVPVSESGFPEPLCASYSKACLETIRRQLDGGAYKITDAFAKLQPFYLEPAQWRLFDPEGLSFCNVNREEDLRRVEVLLRSEAGTT